MSVRYSSPWALDGARVARQAAAHDQRRCRRLARLGIIAGPLADLLEARARIKTNGGCVAFVDLEENLPRAVGGKPAKMPCDHSPREPAALFTA